jgi:ribonucleotide reductase beta subunit family protein with ferritin-like domain
MSIFIENEAYRPFNYAFAAEASKKHSIDMFWDVHQIDLQDDIRQYYAPSGLQTKNVSAEGNKATINSILFLFTELDRSVADGYTQLLPYVKNNEVKAMFLTFAQRETVHQRGYALLAEALGSSDSDWKSFRDYREMLDKIDIIKEDDKDLSVPLNFAKHLTRVFLGEGIGLFAAFTLLLNFKRSGLLMGFNDVNEWSLSDEAFHVENNIKVVQIIEQADLSYLDKIELQRFTTELSDRFEKAENKFIDLIYSISDQEGVTKESLKECMGFLKRLRLYQRGYMSYEEVGENPIEWMDWLLSADKHDSFFEKRVSDYSHSGLAGEIDYSKYQSLLV